METEAKVRTKQNEGDGGFFVGVDHRKEADVASAGGTGAAELRMLRVS